MKASRAPKATASVPRPLIRHFNRLVIFLGFHGCLALENATRFDGALICKHPHGKHHSKAEEKACITDFHDGKQYCK
jgi:hypothetical protein